MDVLRRFPPAGFDVDEQCVCVCVHVCGVSGNVRLLSGSKVND